MLPSLSSSDSDYDDDEAALRPAHRTVISKQRAVRDEQDELATDAAFAERQLKAIEIQNLPPVPKTCTLATAAAVELSTFTGATGVWTSAASSVARRR